MLVIRDWHFALLLLTVFIVGQLKAEPEPLHLPPGFPEKLSDQEQQLWREALDYQKNSDWENLHKTLRKIVRLAPQNFDVWDYAAHTLSYVIAVEFDDVAKRYEYIIHGIDLLIEGQEANPKDSRFASRLGWLIGNKIGKADERLEYRRTFSEDKELHGRLTRFVDVSKANGPTGKPDNFLVARLFCEKAEQIVEESGPPPGNKNRPFSPLLFYGEAPMQQFHFADTIEEEGYYGDEAVQAWREARRLWNRYSERELDTAYGYKVRLIDLEKYREIADQAWKEFDEAHPHIREAVVDRKRQQLTADQQAALRVPPAERTSEQHELVAKAESQLRIGFADLQAALGQKLSDPMRKSIETALNAEQRAATIGTYRDIVNYDPWANRVRLEPTTAVPGCTQKNGYR